MDVELGGTEKVAHFTWWPSLSSSSDELYARVIGLFKMVKKIGEDDPRRVIHSLKVGLALTLVSIFYYVTLLFNTFQSSAMWAVFTVVVVMEYTVGATLSKGLNRAFATFAAGALGIGAHQIANFSGHKGEPILLGIFIFVLATTATFSRFIPEIKARFDYGVSIFILTFSLVAVSSYRADDIILLAHQRLLTIAIGVAICLVTSIFVFPVWAGEDLHELVAANLEKLARFLEGLGNVYFAEKLVENWEGNSFLQCHKSVLNAKATEDSLANFARWEPAHGRFRYHHPWKQYLTIGALIRRCTYFMETLCIHISKSKPQGTNELDLHRKIQAACMELSIDSGKALMDLATSMRTMTMPSTATFHMTRAIATANKLMRVLSDGKILREMLHDATTTSLLAEILKCAEQIVASLEELARMANFKSREEIQKTISKPFDDPECPSVAVVTGMLQNLISLSCTPTH